MNWKKLETFKEISKYKSFNHASKVLKKSQSSFSRDIMSLEKELGFKSKKDIEDFGIEKFVKMCKDRVENIQRSKLSNQNVWDIGWIGKILISPCPMKIIIPYGRF